MKYIVNENNTCGQASLTDDLRNMVLESMGYTPKKGEVPEQINESAAPQAEVEENYDMPTLYEWDGSVFALDDEVFEIEGDLFLKAIEVGPTVGLAESHDDLFINEVRFEEAPFSLGDIYDFGEEIFIKLDEAEVDHSEADAYAAKIRKNYGRGSDAEMDHHAAVKEKYPKYVQASLRNKKDGQVRPVQNQKESKEAPAEETPQSRLQRQLKNLDPSTPKGVEKATELKRKAKAKALDKKNPITDPSQTVASKKAANAAAAAHGNK